MKRHVLVVVGCAAALAAPASARADATVTITPIGVVPSVVTVRAGEAVHWTNGHFLSQSVTAGDGLFDSGQIPAGGGFTMALNIPGEHVYASAANPLLTGTVRVIGRRLGGANADAARERIPRIRFPDPDQAEIAEHPRLTVHASTTRILAGVAESATVGGVNDALEAADAEIVGGLPDLGMLLLSVPEQSGALGRFTGLDRALRTLRSSGAFAFSSMSTAVATNALPRRAEQLLESKPGNWGWDAAGLANWGLKDARFTEAWNLRESIAARGPREVVTGIVDVGFGQHPDLELQTLETLCPPGGPCVSAPNRPDAHGTHVAGTIGARWDNPATPEPPRSERSRGVSGGNPFARMVGTVPTGGGSRDLNGLFLFDGLAEGFGTFLAARPAGLRVINFSAGSSDVNPAKWALAFPGQTCGPGATDDDLADLAAGTKDWCTPNNQDDWLREWAHVGMVARAIAEAAAEADVLIVQAAGNESNDFCVPGWGVSPCAEPQHRKLMHAENLLEFAWASRNWVSELPNPTLIVEAIQFADGRPARFSNIGGDIAAPGRGVMSTVLNNDYEVFNGTSMATPHVTAAAGYLLEDDPSLSVEELRTKLLEWSRPPPAAPVEPSELFDWDTAPRYGLDADADGIVDEHAGEDISAGFPVDFDACGWAVAGQPVSTYTWQLDGETHHTSSCRFRYVFDGEGTYPVALTLADTEGHTRSGSRDVVVDDLLVVGLGDATVAGAGAPELDDEWQDDRCRRSSKGAVGQAARWLESAFVSSTVTFLDLACAGARLRGDAAADGGVLTPFAGFEPADPPLPPQLDEAERLLGARRADAVVLSAGAGDLALAAILADCVEPGNDCSTGEGASIFADRLPVLPLRFGELASRLDALAFAEADVLVTLQPDPTSGDDLGCLPGVTEDEAAWLSETVLDELNTAIADAALLHDWTVVPVDDFDEHGVCADEPWLDLALHPSREGHDALAELVVAELREALAPGAPDIRRAYGDAAPRLDVFAALLTNEGAATNLVDVNDTTRDGNRRVVRTANALDDRPDETVTPGGAMTAPDGNVDMRDFRRFRDAWLQACLAATRDVSCPAAGDIRLDGAIDHPKRDLDFDGCVHLEGDPDGCRATELAFARFDFNGDRRVSVEAKALVPLLADGTPAATKREATRMTDLELLASRWDPASSAEAWGREDLQTLLRSADLEVHADALFAAGATVVRLRVRTDEGVSVGPLRTVRKGEVAVITVPLAAAGGTYEVVAEGDSGATTVSARSRPFELRFGDDRRIDFSTPVRMSVSPSSLPADGESAAAIELRLPRTGAAAASPLISSLGIEGVGEGFADATESLAALPITWTLSPAGGGAQLVDAAPTTDAKGRAKAKLIAGTERQTYTIRAVVDHGDGEVTEAVAEIRVATIVIRYTWRQEIREWWEEGSTRWTGDAPGPDCEDAVDIVVCIDDMRVEYDPEWIALTDDGLVPVGELLPVERTGTITGGGESFEVTEHVGGGVSLFDGDPLSRPGLGQSKATLSLSNPDTGSTLEAVHRSEWGVNDPDAHAEEPVEGMTLEESPEGLRLTGLEAVADLPYHIGASTSNPFREVLAMPREILLVPQGSGDEIRFGPPRGQDLVFPAAGGGFGPVQACGRHLKEYERPAGYLVEGDEEFLGPTADRKFEYTPGDIPMPEGEGRLYAVYSFAATVSYEGAEPSEPALPTCGGPDGPPTADFDWTVSEEAEGRVFRFRDRTTDGEDPIVSWEWEHDAPVGGLNENFQATSTKRNPTFFFPDDGPVTVRLTVTDASGATATVEKDIVLANLPPEASIDDATGQAGQQLSYRFRIVDPGDTDKRELDVSLTSTNPAWPAVEETMQAGTRVASVTLPAGMYPVTLRVTDADGESAEAEAVIRVTAAPPPPPPAPNDDTFATCDPGVVLDAEEQAFLDHLNAYRLANGLRELVASGTLTRAAETHAADMAEHDFLGHDGSDGSGPAERAYAAGYPEEHGVGENVAEGESGLDVDFSWRASISGHNENMLTPEWRVIGIARQEGSKWRWATSFGDFDDCSVPEGDGTEAAPAALRRTAGFGGEAETTFASLAADAEAAESPFLPTTAFTLSHARPRVGGNVTFTNRSDVAAVLELPGIEVPLAPGESATHAFTAPGTQVVRLRTADGTAAVARTLDVLPAPQLTLAYTGPLIGAVGKPFTVSAQAGDPGTGGPAVGIELEFSLAGAAARATTNGGGTAAATLDLAGIAPGLYRLDVRFAGNNTYPAAQTGADVSLFVNAPPTAHAGGPYTAGEGATVLLDGSRSTDPDAAFGDAVAAWRWDADGDGAFDDGEGATVLVPSAAICGGPCETGRDYPIALRATDKRGESSLAAATVRFTADFAVALAGGAMTVVPGAQPSHYGVTVVGSASWTHPVTLSAVGLPAGVTASFSVNPVTAPGTSVLTLTATGTAQTGGATLTVHGTSNGLTRSTDGNLSVAFGLVPQCFGTITGVVRDRDTGAPLADVNFLSLGARTDANGRYTAGQVPLGFNNFPTTYFIQPTRAGYWPANPQPVVAACGVVTERDFQIRRKVPGHVTGLVVDQETEAPIAGARVFPPFAEGPTFTTATNGTFSGDVDLGLDNADRVWSYRADVADYWTEDKIFTVSAGTTAAVQYTLVRKCNVRFAGGRVLDDRTGAPVPGITVAGDSFAKTAVTNALGEYRFDLDLLLNQDNTPRSYNVFLPPQPGVPPGSSAPVVRAEFQTCGQTVSVDVRVRFPLLNRGVIEGYAVDEITGEPIAGATIAGPGAQPQTNQSAVTDASGFYRFESVFVGFDAATSALAFVNASHPNHYFSSRFLTIHANQVNRVDIPMLRHRFASLDASVKDAQTGAPIGGVVIGNLGTTNRDGRLLRDDVPLGTRNAPLTTSATVFAEGYWPQSRSTTFRAGETSVLDYRLIRVCAPARITGTVVNALTQAAIAGATVSTGSQSAQTNAAGVFELRNIPTGTDNVPAPAFLTASAPGFIPQTKQVTVYCGGSIVVDFGSRSTATSTIVGTVTNLDSGLPVVGAFVGGEHGGTATTDALGNYTLPNVPLGDLDADREWEVTAIVNGFKQKTVSVIARAGQTVRADFGFTTTGNDRPVADPQSFRIDEDRGTPPIVLTGSDANGDGLTYHLVLPPAHGRLFGVAPNVQYSPNHHFNGTDEFEFVVFDGQDYSEPARVSIQIDPVNDPPFLQPDEVTRPAGSAARIPVSLVLANDTDVDGDTLTVTSAVGNFGANAFLDGTDIVVSRNGPGDVFVNYRVSDGTVTPSGSLVVHFVAMPVAPTCADASFAGSADQALTGQLACTDGNGDAVTYAVASPPAVGVLSLQPNGMFTYTPPTGFAGQTTFRFRASDGALTSAEATATITIAAANAAPVCGEASYATDEDTTLTSTVACADADADPLTYALAAGPARGTLTLGPGGGFTYLPAANDHGTVSFRYRASDGDLQSAEATATIEIRPVNDAPVADDVTRATDEDTPLELELAATDADGDPVTITAGGPEHGSVANGVYTPAPNYHGADALTYTATDGKGGTDTATVTITVRPVNDAPTAPDRAVSTDEDTAVEITLPADDVDGDSLTITRTSPTHGTFAGATYTPNANYHGVDSFTYTATDGSGAAATGTIAITVLPVNDAPTVAPRALQTDEDTPVAIVLAGDDVDGDVITITHTPPAHGTFDGSTYRPAADYHGPDSFTYTADDGKGRSATAAVSITVRPVNDPPVAPDLDVDTAEETPVTIALAGTDVDGDALTVTAGAPAHGTYTGGVYTPALNFAGSDSFTYTVEDGQGGVAQGTVRITVAGANDPPSVADREVETLEGTPLPLELEGNDPDGDPLSFTWEDPEHGTYDGTTYRPEAGFVGSDAFDYTASDGRGGSATARVRITVRAVTQLSVAIVGPAAVDEGAAPATFSAIPGGVPAGASVTYAWSAGSGTVTSSGDSAGYTNDDGPRTDTVTVTVSSAGATATASTPVAVRNVPPTAEAGGPFTLAWGLALLLSGTASDPSHADTATGLAGRWTFGDGAAPVAGATATRTYELPGLQTAIFTATDKDGGSGSDAATIEIARRGTTLTVSSSSGVFGSAAVSARLADAVHPASARLAGRGITFVVAGRTLTALTDAEGVAVARPPLPLPPGAHAVTARFAGDGLYLASEATGALAVRSTAGRATGGGLRSNAHPGRGGFNAASDGDAVHGELQWQNGADRFHAHELTAFALGADRRSAWIGGRGRDGRAFVAYVEDRGEPGRDDVFRLWIAGVLATPGDGRLDGGNIQIRSPQLGLDSPLVQR